MSHTKFPIKLAPNRVWRTYQGGRRLDVLQNISTSTDYHLPEEWIASTVSARNVGREHITDEGASHLATSPSLTLKEVIEANPDDYLGTLHVQKHGLSTGVLVKLIDADERLTIQVHPDREKAMQLFNSPYGKTECWHILNQPVDSEHKPYVYLGFKEGISKSYWKALFEAQDIEGMLECLHRFEVNYGDTILIEGGIPHAIGKGCFLLETQEPTDYTIRVEKQTPNGLIVDDFLCHQGLGFNTMFDCFNYNGLSREATYAKWFIPSVQLTDEPSHAIKTIIQHHHTPFFASQSLLIHTSMTLLSDNQFSVLYILEGEGILSTDTQSDTLKASDAFFVPNCVSSYKLQSAGSTPLKVLQCFGPQ